MPFIRYTAKKILMITALSNTLAPMVKTYIRAGVIIESVIDCVRWASLACPGAFYIYENFLKKFLPEPNIGHYPFGTMDEREIEISSMCCLKALSLIHGHKRESSVKKKRVCLTWNADLSSPS